MTKYPAQIDNTITLPPAVDDATPVEAKVFNNLRDAVISIEMELGVNPKSTYGTVRARLDFLENEVNNITPVSLGGDLSGTPSAAAVIGIHGRPIAANAPNVNDVLTWNGAVWIPTAGGGGTPGPPGPTGPAGPAGSNGNPGSGYAATSTTSIAVGSGSKSFVTQTGLAYTVGARVRVSSTGSGAYMEGVVSGYSTNTLTINVDHTSGIGSHSDWDINLAGDVGLQGSAGPAGPTGPTGPAGINGVDGYGTLIFRPGGVASGNVYSSWSALMAKRASTSGLLTIIIDDSITSPALVAAGTWDLGKNTIIAGYKGNDGYAPVVFQLPDGAYLRDPYIFENLTVLGASTSTSSIFSNAFPSLDIIAINTTFRVLNSASAPLLGIHRGYIQLFGRSKFENISNGTNVLADNGSVGDVIIDLADESSIDSLTTFISGTYNVLVNINGPSAFYNNFQNNTATTVVNGANFVSNFNSAIDGYVLSKNGVGQTLWVPNGAFPSGPASGDLSGTYPNPSVVKLSISGATQGSILYHNGTQWVQLAPSTDGYVLSTHGPSANPSWFNLNALSLGGDVIGTLPANTVTALQGRNVQNISPTDGYVLTWSAPNNRWQPAMVGSGSSTLNGDVTGPNSATIVGKINGAPVTTIGSTDTILGTIDGVNLTYFQIANAQISSSAAIAKTKLENSTGLSVIGRSANFSGNVADIIGSTNQVLRISGSVLGFGSLDLSTMTTASADVSLNSHKLTDVATPLVATDAANKGYIDGYNFTLVGDVTGPSGSNTVVKINGAPVTTIGSTDTILGTIDGVNLTYFQIANAQISTSAGIAYSKLATIATDSLLGRDSTGTGVLEPISLGSSLQMSGSQVLQRAALTGDVTASVDSNVTTVAKLQNRTLSSSAPTDGYAIIWDNGSSTWTTDGSHFLDLAGQYLKFGGGSATRGKLRLPTGIEIMSVRNNSNTDDASVIRYGVGTADMLYLGSAGADSFKISDLRLGVGFGGSFKFEVNSTTEYTFDSNNANFANNNIVLDGYIALSTSTGVATTGAIRLKNTDSIYSRNATNTTNYFLAGYGADNAAYLGDAANSVTYIRTGGSVSFRPSGSGTDTVTLTSTVLDLKSTIVKSGTNPSSTGTFRLGYGSSVISRNNTNGGDYSLIQSAQVFGVDNTVLIGDNTAAKVESWVNTGGTYVWRVNGTQEYLFDATNALFGSNNIIMDGYIALSSTTPASSGTIRLSNNTAIAARNAGNTGNINLISSDASDHIVIGAGSGSSTNYYNTATAGSHIFQVNAADKYSFNSTTADFKNNTITNLNAINNISIAFGVKGTNLTNADVTKTISDGYIFELPAGTLTASHTLTLSGTGATDKACIEVHRFDTSANTYVISDGTSTIFTFPPSTKMKASFYYDQTNSTKFVLGGWQGIS